MRGMLSRHLLILIAIAILFEGYDSRQFTINYDDGTFIKDGQPFNYVSGSIHYSRVHPDLWYDRLYKMRYAGLDAIQVYVPWNFHETEQGVFNFDGSRDIEKFLTMAQDLGLLVILRPGPFICAEWEFGGFPYWIIRDNASIALRTSDPAYLNYVSKWYSVLMLKMRKLLYVNGGPIISVQVENEYGSYFACDHNYLQYLLSLLKQLLVDDVVYFTTDGDGTGYLKCGALPGTLTTVDFGAGSAKNGYRVLNQWNGSFTGPYVNSEYYIGWLDIWGQPHANVDPYYAAATLDETLKMKANVNMYMFHGGTNFGFSSGAPGDSPFSPVPTSYDYNAALSEAGDLTFKYFLIRNTIGKYKPLPNMDPPSNTTKIAYGKLNVSFEGPLHHCIPFASKLTSKPAYSSFYPERMEVMKAGYGYVLYTHQLEKDAVGATLSVPGIRDRGYVTVNDEFFGILYRDGPTSLLIDGKAGDMLSILVENMGRVNYGSGITRNTKGIISNVTIGDQVNVTSWLQYSYTSDYRLIKECRKERNRVQASSKFVPATYLGVLDISQVADTFIRLDDWFKGHVEINNYNIGRYWTVKGPQKSLFVPSAILIPGKNIISVTELEFAPCNGFGDCQVEFVSQPQLDGEVVESKSTFAFKGAHGTPLY